MNKHVLSVQERGVSVFSARVYKKILKEIVL